MVKNVLKIDSFFVSLHRYYFKILPYQGTGEFLGVAKNQLIVERQWGYY